VVKGVGQIALCFESQQCAILFQNDPICISILQKKTRIAKILTVMGQCAGVIVKNKPIVTFAIDS